MSASTKQLIVVGLIFLAALTYGVFLIIWANDCAAVGGAFIIPENSFPVCVASAR